TDGSPNRQLSTEELLLVWVANRNPAFMRFDELFDDHELAESTDYPSIVAAIRKQTAKGADRNDGQDLVERLLEPGRQAPDSLAGQLRWMRDNWADIVDYDLLERLDRSLAVLAEERVSAERAWTRHMGGGGDTAESAASSGFEGAQGEPESFSQDLDWMPGLVLMAKSTYVWLDQLSRKYGRAIRTLDGIPDEELDQLHEWGFTGLWLIGLWERSHASQRIKQLQGNPDAVASAYSLMDYRIADDLGGEAAWRDLRDRAWARGIRLASDMVPNHMGIDSRWVTEHPEYFIQRADPPYPAYSWTGPNLSTDERVASISRTTTRTHPTRPWCSSVSTAGMAPLDTSITATTAPASRGMTRPSWTISGRRSARRSSGPSSRSPGASRSSASMPRWCWPASTSSACGTRCPAVVAPSRHGPSRP
ncbi:MAG: hypothetical protein LH650_13830, partial [Chloroflexi bacterium]|nr:hypothetical protein [Chloroflexota bacterium]